MEIQKITLHQLDIANKLVEKIDIDLHKETIVKYVDKLIEEILDNPNKRKYIFKDGETQVKSSIKQIINLSDKIETVLLNNAKRLLDKQVDANKRIQRLGIKTQKGSLLHIHFTQNGMHRVLI